MRKIVTSNPPDYPIFKSEHIQKLAYSIYEDKRSVDSYYFKGETDFEKELINYLDTKHCFVTNSGHASIYIALMAAGIGPGDEVITTSISWGQTLSPILQLGATPIFIDIDDSFQLNYSHLTSAITEKTKAVLTVNLYGASSSLDKIRSVCDTNDIIMIEDAAQSMGLKFKEKYTATWGHIGALSFNSGKLLPIGGAGAIVTDSEELWHKILYYGSKAAHKRKGLVDTDFECDGMDYTFLCHPLLQEMGRIQLRQLSKMNKNRRNNITLLRNLIDTKHFDLQHIPNGSDIPAYIFSFVNKTKLKIDQLIKLFKQVGLPMFRYNPFPLSNIPGYTRFPNYRHSMCTNAERLSKNELCITSYKWYTEDTDYIEQYAEAINYISDEVSKNV